MAMFRAAVSQPLGATQTSCSVWIAGVLSRSLRRHGHGFRINTEGLRKAWLVEQVASNTPIPTFQAAAELKSLRSLERLIPYAPRPPASPVHLAYELGGIESHEKSRRS